ncbi:MAG: hypothetical protein JNL44_00355 [Gemmatimonadetes bacterium]|nr:hypothetical protein [Gemmatimonadota bacterium]
MKKLLPFIAFLATFAIGGGTAAILMKPAAPTASAGADTSHAATPGAPATPETAPFQPPLSVYDPAVGSDDPHVADPPLPSAAVPAGSIGDERSAAGTSSPGQVTPAASSRATTREGDPITIGSLVGTNTGATVMLRPDGTVGPEPTGSFQAIPDYARMARLLTKMSPREAARTVEQLSGDEAARALAQMNDKSAAAVLGQLSPEKAAALLQAVLALVPKPAVP